MKIKSFNYWKPGIPVATLLCFLLLSGIKEPGHVCDREPNARPCCSGHRIDVSDLRKFMLDSLHGNQHEGGAYTKSDLMRCIENTPGDTVYVLNVLVNQATDLVFTSSTAQGVHFARLGQGGYCSPCPQKPCCPKYVKAARVNRNCISYTDEK